MAEVTKQAWESRSKMFGLQSAGSSAGKATAMQAVVMGGDAGPGFQWRGKEGGEWRGSKAAERQGLMG